MHLMDQLWTQRRWAPLLAALIFMLWLDPTAKGQIAAPIQFPITATVLTNANLRAGPGTSYAIVGKAREGQLVTINRSNNDEDWYQLSDEAWIAAFLVETDTFNLLPTATSKGDRRLVATATPISGRQLVATATGNRQLVQTATVAKQATPSLATTALRSANLRAGPGTAYAIVGGAAANDALDLQGRTADGTWYQLRDGSWIAAFLVNQTIGALPTVASTIIAGLPTAVPPPTATSQPSVPTTDNQLAGNAPAGAGNTTFVVTRRRLWNPWENGGSTDGPSVHCGQARSLSVNVLDEHGNRINGVAVQVVYGAQEIYVTGSQGKGDGIAEFVLGNGQDVKVIRDTDGTPVTSEVATGLSTDPRGIDQESLISAGYCQDAGSCQTFANNLSCIGHFSWTVTFERRR